MSGYNFHEKFNSLFILSMNKFLFDVVSFMAVLYINTAKMFSCHKKFWEHLVKLTFSRILAMVARITKLSFYNLMLHFCA